MTSGSAVSNPIPVTRLDQADPALLDELLEVVEGVARKGAFTMGAELEGFEDEFATYCGSAHSVGVSSGTEAISLALRALEIGAGDEVIVPTNSFIATAEAVSWVGATAKLVDVDPSTHLLTAEQVAAAITPRTRAVIPVHLMGSTVDLDPIMDLAREAGLRVIEDTAQAHGADHRGRRVGSIGDIGCFSFYPTKNLGGWGDGGAIATDDEELAARVRLLRSHGESPRYHHRMVGTTARLDALQAAILRVKLRRLDDRNADRRRLGAALRAGLEGTSVELPSPAFEGADHVYHLFIVRSQQRDALRAHLEQHGVSSAVHYPFPIHLTEAYGPEPKGSLPNAEALAEQILTLPLFPTMSDDEVARVIAAVESFDSQE
ncbi:dTDP-4-amino-4,6-dideoxygalactose transaminase [Solirubrobacter pauli]|uniref:dTDP-4-amino-4,6-dideoxygalactose transaminase n=1 Tax=Solirubrobacter pauli TaxID=166793 RepID=A0A660KX78_9ACTN|nr:DegT/DnrJ/EryC1/StrS family aminotransferase [Solirubrobacter pauli]RKQ85062.1 dTDP-4-amino-4,6-dideoxygalactose transaminase [Solirubrobacter pauli]